MKQQNRRNFLKAGTTLGASLLATSAFSFNSSPNKATQGNKDKKHSTIRERKKIPRAAYFNNEI